jgi:hypothetical protein
MKKLAATPPPATTDKPDPVHPIDQIAAFFDKLDRSGRIKIRTHEGTRITRLRRGRHTSIFKQE